MPRLAAALLLTLSAGALGGCIMVPAILVTSAIELVDETASLRLDMNCATTHLLLIEPYCRSRTVPNNQPPVYCFRTLGGVDCYAEDDPYGVGESSRVKPGRPLAAPRVAPVAVAQPPVPVPQPPEKFDN